MTRWDDTWPATRLEAHYGDRVVRCFSERPASLFALLADAAARFPEGEAIVCVDERMCWRELHALSARLAAGLAQLGIRAGDRVAMLIGNRSEFVTTLFAIAHLGAIAVPISIREQTPGLAYMINDCAAALIVHDADLADRLPAAADIPSVRTRVSRGIFGVLRPAGSSRLRVRQPPIASLLVVAPGATHLSLCPSHPM